MPASRLNALLLLTCVITSCAGPPRSGAPADQPASMAEASASASSSSLWALDLVRTRPGMQGEYLRSIEVNWGGARHLAREQGAVRSYLALAAAPDSARGWDVMLLTEYAGPTAFAEREETFRAIFASPRFMAGAVSGGPPSSELRDFIAGEVVMQKVISGGF